MAEERETTQIETPEETASGLPIMPAAGHLALAMGLQGAAENPNLAKATGDLLAKQSAMLDVQMEDLHEQRLLQISHLRLRRWGEWLSLILRGLSVAGGIALAFALAVVVWQARNASGIIITPFSVPPELAATGLTGDVVANRLLDRLAELQEQTDSARAPETFRNAGQDDIRVEIPETGVSIGELLKILRSWLGHETHISGDVVRMGTALTVTSRVGETPGRGFTGDPAKLDDLIKQAAETVYAKTQPYRYGVYLSRNGRNAEALEVMKALALKGPESERAWGYIGWGFLEQDCAKSVAILRQALALNPSLATGWTGLAENESCLGRDEASLNALQKAHYLLNRSPSAGGVSPTVREQVKHENSALLAEAQGDFGLAASIWETAAGGDDYNTISVRAGMLQAINLALNHDLSLLERPQDLSQLNASPRGLFLRARAEIARAQTSEDWSTTAPTLMALESEARVRGPGFYTESIWKTQVDPWIALGLARSGDLASARALISATQTDCYACVRVRGLVEAEAGQFKQARQWLDLAIQLGPHLPFAYIDQAKLQVTQGNFKLANDLAQRAQTLAPNWPDAARVSGDALAGLRRCSEASNAYTRALRLAPKWVRTPQMTTNCPA